MKTRAPRRKKYPIELTDADRNTLKQITRSGTNNARVITRARILLQLDQGKHDAEICATLNTSASTVGSIRKRCSLEGLESALYERCRPGAVPKLDSIQEAALIALACSDAPNNRESWTMQLLADRMVELKVVESLSDETVRRKLKKMLSNPGKREVGASRS
jgi:putative transposase